MDDVWEIDYIYTAMGFTVFNSGMVDAFNATMECGTDTWVIDERMDLLGLECASIPTAELGEEWLSVFKVASEGAALYVGELPVDDTRQTALSLVVYTRP